MRTLSKFIPELDNTIRSLFYFIFLHFSFVLGFVQFYLSSEIFLEAQTESVLFSDGEKACLRGHWNGNPQALYLAVLGNDFCICLSGWVGPNDPPEVPSNLSCTAILYKSHLVFFCSCVAELSGG